MRCGRIPSVTSYYNRPSQAGPDFSTVATATTLPIMIYDIPMRTGRKVDTDTLLRLAVEVDKIVAVKDAAGDPVESALLLDVTGRVRALARKRETMP